MDGLEIRVLTDEYAEETLKLFNSVFSLSKTMDFWIEKHYKNPLGNSLFIGAFYEDKLIAMNAFMPMQYVYQNCVFNVMESCESAVSPEYRHKGIFLKLIKFAEEWLVSHDYDLIIGLPNINSYPAFMKLGWEVVSVTEHFGRIGNFKKWIEEKKHVGIRPLTDAFLLLNYVKNKLSILFDNKYVIREVEIETFLKEYYKKDDFIRNKYDTVWLAWRLSNNGHIFAVSDSDKMVVLCIVIGKDILFLDGLENECCDVIRALRYFGREGLKNESSITIYADINSEIRKNIYKAGFVTKREPQQTKIVKKLSMRALSLDKNISWINQMI